MTNVNAKKYKFVSENIPFSSLMSLSVKPEKRNGAGGACTLKYYQILSIYQIPFTPEELLQFHNHSYM